MMAKIRSKGLKLIYDINRSFNRRENIIGLVCIMYTPKERGADIAIIFWRTDGKFKLMNIINRPTAANSMVGEV